jgi:hypothetical protein
MTTEVERKLKIALDESRLLILGAQVLFGFQFQAAFQDLYADVPDHGRWVHCAGLLLLLISICCLMAPSLYHQIIFDGESRAAAIIIATRFAGASLLPFTLGLGAAAFVAFARMFGPMAGILFSLAFILTGLILLYGAGFVLRRPSRTRKMPKDDGETPLTTKIEQMLTEARVMLPGGQALLGFQLVATLTKSFHQLPLTFQYIHAAGLCAVALAVTLLMTPAALHRIAFHGDDDAGFFRIGSTLVVMAACPLAMGIAADVAVVFFQATQNRGISGSAGVAALGLLLGAWLAYPAWCRTMSSSSKRAAHG